MIGEPLFDVGEVLGEAHAAFTKSVAGFSGFDDCTGTITTSGDERFGEPKLSL